LASIQAYTLPAPVGGVDNSQAISAMQELNCLYAYNMSPESNGLRVRDGYSEWANGTTGTTGVRTIVPFVGAAEDGSEDKLFAVTREGVFDVTTQGTTSPTQVVTWGTTTGDAGLCSYTQMETIADVYLFVADGANGVRRYAGSTGTWSTPSLTGPTAASVSFVMAWKNILWFIEGGTGSAWYLPVGTIAGTATEFQFGNRFQHGGFLVGMYNWTVDGGDGSDDYLAIISSSGDLLVYRGTNPDTIFELQGSWYVGKLPAGRKIAVEYGGDLLLLSRYGILSMAALLRGLDISSNELYITYKISASLRVLLTDTHTSDGWEVLTSPHDNLLFVLTPKREGYAYLQYVMNLSTGAWAAWQGVPMQTACVGPTGDLYFGCADNSVFETTGFVDGVTLAGATGDPIQSALLSAFSTLGTDPAKFKKVGMIRPLFKAQSKPEYLLKTRVDFDVEDVNIYPTEDQPQGNEWDAGVWDAASWIGGAVSLRRPQGSNGLGIFIAVAINMTTIDDTTLAGFNVLFQEGGML
jgi:hypothetical protein